MLATVGQADDMIDMKLEAGRVCQCLCSDIDVLDGGICCSSGRTPVRRLSEFERSTASVLRVNLGLVILSVYAVLLCAALLTVGSSSIASVTVHAELVDWLDESALRTTSRLCIHLSAYMPRVK